ncbi:hypothetical protein JOQ06_010511, partial [Pogonophryne albipinna]
MGSVGAERRRPTPAQTPEERDVWRDGGRAGWREVGRDGWREGRESGVVQSFSFDSYQLEEEEISKDAPERGVLALSEPDFEEPIPDDRYHGIYFAMLLAGVGFLLPYNSFITDVDYLHHKFQGTSIVFDLSLTYILVALLAVILNNVLVERLSLHTRITVGYILALGPLLFVSVFDVWLAKFTTGQAYVVNLVSVGVVAFGCTVQQSSFYGYMGMLPKRYTQGVMTGESTAGVIISLSRIFTKLLIPGREEEHAHLLPGVHQHGDALLPAPPAATPREKGAGKLPDARDNGTGYRVHHDVTAEEGNGATAPTSAEEVVEDFEGGTYVRFDAPKAKIRRSWPRVKDMILHRYVVSRVIWAYMLSIAVTYSITLCLFPGLESEIRNSRLGEWFPILIMATFNMSDFVGKSEGGLHPPLRHVCLPGQRPHPVSPRLALHLLPPHGSHQRILRVRADDPGRGEVPPEQRELA